MHKFLLTAAIFTLFASAVQAETIKTSVNGLVCAFCATGIEKTFKAQSSVESIKVDLENKLVTIDTKQGQTMDDNTITKLINDAGYMVTNIVRNK